MRLEDHLKRGGGHRLCQEGLPDEHGWGPGPRSDVHWVYRPRVSAHEAQTPVSELTLVISAGVFWLEVTHILRSELKENFPHIPLHGGIIIGY